MDSPTKSENDMGEHYIRQFNWQLHHRKSIIITIFLKYDKSRMQLYHTQPLHCIF